MASSRQDSWSNSYRPPFPACDPTAVFQCLKVIKPSQGMLAWPLSMPQPLQRLFGSLCLFYHHSQGNSSAQHEKKRCYFYAKLYRPTKEEGQMTMCHTALDHEERAFAGPWGEVKLKNGRRTVCLSLVTTSTLKLTGMIQQKQFRHKTRQPELAHLMLWGVVRGLWELQVSWAEPRQRPDYTKALLQPAHISVITHLK